MFFRTMIFKISTYQPDKHSNTKYKFYIQSKGNNAGRPLREPKANCWIVETDISLAYEICTVLWTSKIYEAEITGSVIPFIRMHDYLKITMPYLVSSIEFEKPIEEGLKAISSYDLLIDNTLSKLKLIKSLKIVTAHELLKKIGIH
jgi:hypothetical protein